MLDKRDTITRIAQHYEKEDFQLELGCGARKRSSNAIGIDLADHPCVDIVGDMTEVLTALPQDSIAKIEAFHSLEHIEDLAFLIGRIGNVLKQNGTVSITVPHFSNPHFYSDYTHKQFFGLYTLCYLVRSSLFKRGVPQYNPDCRLRLVKVSLLFKSSPPFYGRHVLKKVVGMLVNSCRAAQEFYEECLCWVFPCYEIRYLVTKDEQ